MEICVSQRNGGGLKCMSLPPAPGHLHAAPKAVGAGHRFQSGCKRGKDKLRSRQCCMGKAQAALLAVWCLICNLIMGCDATSHGNGFASSKGRCGIYLRVIAVTPRRSGNFQPTGRNTSEAHSHSHSGCSWRDEDASGIAAAMASHRHSWSSSSVTAVDAMSDEMRRNRILVEKKAEYFL